MRRAPSTTSIDFADEVRVEHSPETRLYCVLLEARGAVAARRRGRRRAQGAARTAPEGPPALLARLEPAALAVCNRARAELGLPPAPRLADAPWRGPSGNPLSATVGAGLPEVRVEATPEGLLVHRPEGTLRIEHSPGSRSFAALAARSRRRGRRGGRRERARRERRELALAA